MVDKKDRKDYEEGVRDSKRGCLVNAITDMIGTNPNTDAYHKGRRSEQLDADKKDDKKK